MNCENCKKEVEVCMDGYCKECHVSISWEDCTTKTDVAQQMRRKENMKFKAEFEKWFELGYGAEFSHKDERPAKRAWEACEDFYESRKCENCKYSFERSNFPAHLLACRKGVNISNRFDFYCQYWEQKTA